MRKPFSGARLAAASTLALAGDALAGPLDDRFSLSIGTFLVETNTDVRVDSETRTGTEIDLEGELGFDDRSSLRIDGYWRFAERHKVRLLYFDTDRSASKQLQRDIVFQGETYTFDTLLESEFKTQVAELAYEYAFMRRETFELAGSVGIHNLKFKLALSTTPAGSSTVRRETEAGVNGPLPVFGLRAIWQLPHRIHIDGQVQVFSLKIDPYEGSITDVNLAAVWMPSKHLGIGLGYNNFVTRLDVTDDDFSGSLRWKYGGVRLFLTASF